MPKSKKKIDELFISENYLESQIIRILDRIDESEERMKDNPKMLES